MADKSGLNRWLRLLLLVPIVAAVVAAQVRGQPKPAKVVPPGKPPGEFRRLNQSPPYVPPAGQSPPYVPPVGQSPPYVPPVGDEVFDTDDSEENPTEEDRNAAARPGAVLRSALRRSMLRRHKQAGFTPNEQQWVETNCKYGMPKAQEGADLGPMRIIAREGYVLGHSSESKIPYWVCEHLTTETLSGHLKRKEEEGTKDPFKPDPQLAGYPRSALADYRGSGFDRGHMAPAGDQTQSRKLKNETFYLSNIAPQIGPSYNRGIWKELETNARDWATERGEAWVITGPLFYDPLEEDDDTADGMVPYYTIGEDEVAVPTHYYKIVVCKQGDDLESIAFVLENKKYGKPYRLEPFIVTVKWIEDRTGLDFMPDLSDDPGKLDFPRTWRTSLTRRPHALFGVPGSLPL